MAATFFCRATTLSTMFIGSSGFNLFLVGWFEQIALRRGLVAPSAALGPTDLLIVLLTLVREFTDENRH